MHLFASTGVHRCRGLKTVGTTSKVGTIAGTSSPVGTTLAATDFLTESRIRSARPKARPYKLRDGGGLYLLVTPANARLWRLRYKARGRESMLGLGTYPATSLKAARDRRTELRAALEAGKKPAAQRRAARASAPQNLQTHAREGGGGASPFPPNPGKGGGEGRGP